MLTERGEEEAEAGALPPRRPGKKAPAPRAPEMGTRRRKHPRAEEEEEGEEGKKNLESGGGGRRGQEEKRGERERLPSPGRKGGRRKAGVEEEALAPLALSPPVPLSASLPRVLSLRSPVAARAAAAEAAADAEGGEGTQNSFCPPRRLPGGGRVPRPRRHHAGPPGPRDA
ncbi:hypothetical protein EG867_15885, partial [Enterococcus faecalis]